jgi:RHS repeat-associated protein
MFFSTLQSTSVSNTFIGFSSFTFNGKESDNEVFSTTASFQDYGMRMYDTKVCRFISTDPLSPKYAWNSTYSFGENDVIRSIDLDGAEKYIVNLWITDGKVTGYKIVFVKPDKRVVDKLQQQPGTDYTRYNIIDNGVARSESMPTDQFNTNYKFEKFGQQYDIAPKEDEKVNLQADKIRNIRNGVVPAVEEPSTFNLENLFKTDQYEIDPDKLTKGQASIDALNDYASYLIANNKTISISGHTDNVPTTTYPGGNMELSQKRAQAVADYLKSKGLPSTNIKSVQGKGDTEPINPHNTPTPDTANRRVEITIEK